MSGETAINNFAHTALQLYNQLLEKNFTETELKLIKRSYEISTKLFSGIYSVSGKESISHNVGTASILCCLGQQAEVISAGLLHNAYGGGEFDLARNKIEDKRKFIISRINEEVEKYLYQFYILDYNYNSGWRKDFLKNPESIKSEDIRIKTTLLIIIADTLEHNLNSDFLWRGDWQKRLIFFQNNKDNLINMANILGYPLLGSKLKKNIENNIKNKDKILINTSNKRVEIIVPKSYRKKWKIKLINKNNKIKSYICKRTKRTKRLFKKLLRNLSEK